MRKRDFSTDLQRRFAGLLGDSRWLRPGMKVGAAVSGGADSVALLVLLAHARAQLGIVLSVVHFNHKLRGKASDSDERFVSALAEEFGLTLHLGRADVAGKAKREKANLEDAARRARYSFFERLADQGLLDVVATAHTMDDQAETVLAHVLRGTGLAGLAGIHSEAGRVKRPLLAFRRHDLRKYLRQCKQSWREDATNRDTRRTRARMRKKLLPLLLKDFNPAAVEHLAGLARRAGEHALFLGHLSERLLSNLVHRDAAGARISLSDLLNPLNFSSAQAACPLSNALIERIVASLKTRRGQLSSAHLDAVARLAQAGEPGKLLQLPGGVDVLRERDSLLFRPRS